MTCGDRDSDGDSSIGRFALRLVDKIYSVIYTFATVLNEGTLVTRDRHTFYGDSTSVKDEQRFGGCPNNVNFVMRLVDKIYSTGYAFATVLNDGFAAVFKRTVVTWGNQRYSCDSSKVRFALRFGDKSCFPGYGFVAV